MVDLKKIIIALFICLMFCSCGKKEEDKYKYFDHYKLENFNKHISYNFASDEYNKNDIYVVADITPSNTYFFQDTKNNENKIYFLRNNVLIEFLAKK